MDNIRYYENMCDDSAELKKYKDIGTVEELRKLKERNEPKKPTTTEPFSKCPVCDEYVEGHYCSNCGQRIDWNGVIT